MEGKWSSWRVEVEDSVGDFVYRISKDWMINLVVLVSMMVQLLLAFGGALRYRSGSSVLQLVIWLGYMSADALAIYALGVMAHTQSRAILFGIWAPILLSHLGGPDTISAYSTPDNELWLRHLLTMLYQISVAAYVVYLSQLGGYLLAAALILLVVGISKYAERTMALRSSSLSQIVSSADPMNVFMQLEGGKCNYLVMGLKQWRKRRNLMVTINDVWNSEGKHLTENYLLCLSHALFKMNKRRYVNLYLHERYYNTTRDFYFSEDLSHIHASPEKIFAVAEMELKFLYDLLFSKSSGTAFSKVGTVMRLVNICLLGITGFLVYSELSSHRVVEQTLSVQRMVAYVLLSVALVLEIVQFCRIIASDWTMVWLICTRIQHSRGRRNEMDAYMTKLMKIAIQVSSCFRKCCRGGYWKKQISQYSIIDTCSHISPCIWKLTKFLRLTSLVTGWYTQTQTDIDDLKTIIVDQLKGRCSSDKGDVENCRTQLESYDYGLVVNNCEDLKWASRQDQEHLILHWHIATTICEMQRVAEPTSSAEEENIKRNVRISGKLSRYCAYLLVSTPKLLPLHPDIANVKHMDVHNELIGLADLDYNTMKSYEKYSTLGHGAKLARELQQKPEDQRWKIISDYWSGVIIFYALKNKASAHAERLTVGGEFLTLLWAIVGHIGVGDQ